MFDWEVLEFLSLLSQSRPQSEFVALLLLWDTRGRSAIWLEVRHFAPILRFGQIKQPRHVKIQRKAIFFTYSYHHLQLISKIRRITSHFIFEAAVKFLEFAT